LRIVVPRLTETPIVECISSTRWLSFNFVNFVHWCCGLLLPALSWGSIRVFLIHIDS